MDTEAENEFISTVIKQALSGTVEEIPADFYRVGASLPRWHLVMLQDKRRLKFYSDIIKTKVKGKIVLDLGTGSGILSHLALKWGAKKVYSVEENPSLQAVYRHLMRKPIAEGRAELICDDAHFLRKDQFPDGIPDLVVHELFGAFGMGEALVPIFRALRAEGLLTDETELVPDLLEVWIRPMFSEEISQEGELEDFEDYGLSELNIFGHQDFWQQEYLSSSASGWKIAGNAQMLFECNLRDLKLPDTVLISVEASQCSHLKMWMKIVDTKSGLEHENDHQFHGSHWANVCLSVPYWLRGESFQVEFRVHPDKVEVLRFFK